MKPLSTLDTLFVTLETPRFSLHGMGVLVFDPATAPEAFTFERVKEHIRKNLPQLPPLRKRLVQVPLGLEKPVWIEDPDFDLDSHFHRVAVPPPGSDIQLAELAGELGTPPLDFSRPLWDCWFVQGLEGGRIALFLKMHHACIDGMGGIEMLFQLFDSAPTATRAELPPDTWEPDRVPQPIELLTRSLVPVALRPLRTARATAAIATGMARSRAGREPKAKSTARLFGGPRVSFNRVFDGPARRAMAWVDVSMDDVRTIRKAFDAKLNDVALALCAGSLHRYLAARGELPEQPLTVANPVNIREQNDTGQFENRVAIMGPLLQTHIADPEARLLAIIASTTETKAATRRSGTNYFEQMFDLLPPGVAHGVLRAFAVSLARTVPPPFNTCITNLMGPPLPLYFCGARLEGMYIEMMQVPSVGLIVALISYAGRLQFSITATRELVPDVWAIAHGITEELELLLKAAAAA